MSQSNNEYFTFQIVCPKTKNVIFVGYGTGRADIAHLSSYKLNNPEWLANDPLYEYLRGLMSDGYAPIVERIHDNITREESKRLKIERCRELGAGKPGSHLFNRRPDEIVTQETKERTRSSLKGRPLSEKHRKNLCVPKRSREGYLNKPPISEETRARMSASQKGRRHTPESRAKMREAARARRTKEKR